MGEERRCQPIIKQSGQDSYTCLKARSTLVQGYEHQDRLCRRADVAQKSFIFKN